jgi:hypothetical protein
MTLKGAWPPALVAHLNTIAGGIWAKWHYDIDLEPFDANPSCGGFTSTFNGSGKYAFYRNLQNLGRWTEYEIKEKPEYGSVYGELLRGMRENGLTVEVSYSDEEGGCFVLYRQTGILSSDGRELAYEVTSEENLDYNWDNYEDVTDDTEALASLVESLCGQLGIENDGNGLIERWARVRTYPHCTGYDSLGEDAQAEFKEVFLDNGIFDKNGIFNIDAGLR